MKNDIEHLNVDLEFLGEAKPREAETIVKSGYKINWRNITIFGGLFVVGMIIIWVNSDDKSSAPRKTSPASDVGGTVQNGKFSCSRYDLDQANRLSPISGNELTTQQQVLERRSNALDRLKTQINLSPVNQSSSQTAIDSFNATVDRYNTQLMSYKSDVAEYEARVDQFNSQVHARNNYLLAHCRKRG